jgi:hypothetical protein
VGRADVRPPVERVVEAGGRVEPTGRAPFSATPITNAFARRCRANTMIGGSVIRSDR